MWDLIVSVPDHCLSFYFSHDVGNIRTVKSQINLHLQSRQSRTV